MPWPATHVLVAETAYPLFSNTLTIKPLSSEPVIRISVTPLKLNGI